jgi:hypothetical protein
MVEQPKPPKRSRTDVTPARPINLRIYICPAWRKLRKVHTSEKKLMGVPFQLPDEEN